MTRDVDSGDLYSAALELRACANSWEPSARLLGNVRADMLAAVMSDYLRLRFQAGITGRQEKENAK
jgi:hypothetical protein